MAKALFATFSRWASGACATLLLTASMSVASDNALLIGDPSSLAIEPAAATLIGPRSQQQLIVTARYEGDLLRDLTSASDFTSENPEVATINAAGTVTPRSNGTTSIVATVAGKETKIAVTV